MCADFRFFTLFFQFSKVHESEAFFSCMIVSSFTMKWSGIVRHGFSEVLINGLKLTNVHKNIANILGGGGEHF